MKLLTLLSFVIVLSACGSEDYSGIDSEFKEYVDSFVAMAKKEGKQDIDTRNLIVKFGYTTYMTYSI